MKTIPEDSSFPRELMIKVVYRVKPGLDRLINDALLEKGLEYSLQEKESNKSSFRSYTLNATFNSEGHLDEICAVLSQIEGYMMML